MYVRSDEGSWVKIAGTLGGSLKLKQEKPNLIVAVSEGNRRRLVEELVELETGLWHRPFEELIGQLPFRDVLTKLAECYSGVRIPIAPHDFNCILIAVALSRRTSYERFVLNWCQKIWKLYGCDLEKIAGLPESSLKYIGSSYQVLQLKEILASFLEMDVGELLKLKPDTLRTRLLSTIKLLGPKAVDSLILSTFKALHFIPCDVHLYTVSSRLRLIEPETTLMPQKSFCAKYACTATMSKATGGPLCPKSGNCLRAKLSWLGETGGWFQTIAYIHGSRICRTKKPLCGECCLRQICQQPLNL
jgi:endonuclease III